MGKNVAIIVLNHNGLRALGSKLLKRCLNGVLNTDYRDFIVVFVDNGSTPMIRKLCIQLRARYALYTSIMG
ncbi:glycosyltransferase [Infirmifilum sp. SLHALR2]